MKKVIILILAMLIIVSGPLFSVTIKIGSIAPAKSPWDKALRELGREWKSISGGEIKVKIYPGGIAGSDRSAGRRIVLCL